MIKVETRGTYDVSDLELLSGGSHDVWVELGYWRGSVSLE